MSAATYAGIVASATPLVFAATGEVLTERSGVVNLSLDGSIMLSALAGFVAAVKTGNVGVGFLAAAGVGATIAGVVALGGIRLGRNQIAVGFVLTLLCAELSSFVGGSYVRRPGPALTRVRVPVLSELPWIGTVLFRQSWAVYASYLVVAAAWVFLYRTRPGLELQAVGERPEAAWARGVQVNRLRYRYTLLGGALVGVAGAAFSLDVKLGWSEGHTRNFGWIALAIVIFGGWHPVRAAFGCYLFGALQVAAVELQPELPDLAQVLPILPFPLMILTLVVLQRAWIQRLTGRWPAMRQVFSAHAPGALGTRFEP